MKEERRKIQEVIEGTLNKGKGSEAGKHRDAMKALRDMKGALINEKKAIRAQLDSLKAAGDKLVKDRKDQRSTVKFSSPEEIDKEIAKLQRQQETTSMSLTEEKKLIKEMDALKASKNKIKDLKSTETDMEAIKLKRKVISDSIAAKDKEIDAVSKQIDAGQEKIKELSDKDTEKRSALDGLFKKRDDLKKAIADKLKEKDTLRDAFREANNAWYNYQRAIKAQKQIQYLEEKKLRDEEKAAYLAKAEEEEAKKIPYEEEQALCDYLADYLERTYVTTGDEGPKVAEKKEDVVAVKDDPFAGFKPVVKKLEEEVEYFGKGKGKKKRQRAPKKPEAAGPFTLNVDSFEQFGLIGLSPPTSRAEVEGSIKELREKKEWYKNQPRGSVPTAKDIRKQNEKAAAKLRQDGGAPATPTPSRVGKFDLSNTDEFVPLGKGASNAVDASSWGQKPAAASAPEPAEAS
mmetsp:Transcript_63055/g.174397  ORF Transcript_63055/g.174397 Transcript_63055/m.174397 type:complete len:460 (+) Transcript_63055:3-1382(+)